jgi:LacI family transcriptional regulator
MARIGIREIARLANVSIGTVDRALHGRKRISKKTRERVLTIARNMGFRPNLVARALSVGGKPVRVGVCIPREIHFFYDQLRDGILAEAHHVEHLGLEVIYHPVERLGAMENETVREMLATDIQALVITPGDPRQLTPLIDEAEKRNIRVVCVASDAPASHRSTVVCVNPRLNGRLAAELMGRFVEPGAQVAVITGMLQTDDHREKTEGFAEVFPHFCPGGKVVEVIEGHEEEDEAFQKCFSLLGRLEHLAGLYVNTANCLPVCRAIGARGLSGKIKLITTDLFREMIPYFEKGTVSASIYQRPYVQGQTALRLLGDHFIHGRPLPPTHYLNPQIVMYSNLRLFRETRLTDRADGSPLPSSTVASGMSP